MEFLRRTVAIARLAALFTGDNMIPLSEFPAIDATLNATSALLLTLGYFFIRRKRIQAHKVCMVSAFATSSLFLGCYIWYHAHHGVTRFARQGAVRDLYLALLGSHTILAVVIVPLILTTLYRAWRGRFERHKKIARWTLPLWFYVSVTGVVVYWMLYHLYAQVAAR
jgi:putative membrane protein